MDVDLENKDQGSPKVCLFSLFFNGCSSSGQRDGIPLKQLEYKGSLTKSKTIFYIINLVYVRQLLCM